MFGILSLIINLIISKEVKKMNNNALWENMESYTWKCSKETARFNKYISKAMESIHSKIPKQQHSLNKVATETNIREECFQGVNYKRAVMYLMSNGCEWALKDGNGCTMCGHIAKQTRQEEPISVSNYMEQFKSEFESIDFAQYPLLNLYNNGSILNEYEVPSEALQKILQIIAEKPEIKMLVLESRPEFITEERMYEIKKLLHDKYVEIAVGLELVDDFLRYICINKGFSLKQYDNAASIATRYINLRTYVMLKPPFLSEREAIQQAVKTIEYAFKAGSTTVSLEACTVQDYTLVQYLSERKAFQPAWLWSIIEVVRRTAHLGNLIIGLFQFYPSPVHVPYNCPHCSVQVMEAIKEYNRTLNLDVFNHLNCSCKNNWKKVLEEEVPSFEERLKTIIAI